MMEGIVSDFKRMSVHDGPGIRTTMFLKGCPLRCLWCHNPENLTVIPSVSYTKKLCIGCGMCVKACPQGVHVFSQSGHFLDREKCIGCGKCVEKCLPGALVLFGKAMTAEEAARKLLEDRAFYARSGGGVTFSGGEPLMQSRFLAEVMKILKAKGIHIAVDTCGDAAWENFEDVLPYADLFLYDIKHLDDEMHRRGTGRGSGRILENLRRLAEIGAAAEIRTPVIPGYNDDAEHLQRIAEMLAGLRNITAWRLLPYHSMAKGKYEALGMEYPMEETEMPDGQRMRELQTRLAEIFPGTMLSAD